MGEQRQYHLIGIGGIGMSGIARLLLSTGVSITGSDVKQNAITESLARSGVTVFIGHKAENVAAADVVIYSSAVKDDNPEVLESLRKGIPLLKRAQALAELMQDKDVITVAGSHGKTTTSSLVSHLLLDAGLFPTIAVGGIVRNIDTNASSGTGAYFVAEADESDGSFLYYRPKYSIVTNIDYEHMDYYKNFDNELEAFEQFVRATRHDGAVIYCADDKALSDIAARSQRRSISYGSSQSASVHPRDIVIGDLRAEFDCSWQGRMLGRFCLALGGMHNVSNALAVIALGMELGIDVCVIKRALATYKGSGRRQEVKFRDERYVVIDDYAHHPTEIRATLAAVKHVPGKRLIAVFQPHRYSRTHLLFDEFARSFSAADYLFVTDIYAASEQPLEGVSGRTLCEKIRAAGTTTRVGFLEKKEIVPTIMGMLRPSDVVVTLGAGDITKVCDEFVSALAQAGK